MTGRAVTPNGRLLTTADPGTPEWLAARKGGITATDLPKILGLSKWGTGLDVWADKLDLLPDEPIGEAAEWGTLLEPVVAKEWARRNGVKIRRVGILHHATDPHAIASLDRLVIGCTVEQDVRLGPCALEVKTRHALTEGLWREGIPDDVLAQVVWQLHVAGVDHVHVAVLLGGQEMRESIVRYRDVVHIIRSEVAAAKVIWDAVQSRTRPEVDPTPALYDSLTRVITDRDGAVDITGRVDIAGWVAEYLDAHEAVKTAEERKLTAKAALTQALGDAAVAVSGGKRVYSRTTKFNPPKQPMEATP